MLRQLDGSIVTVACGKGNALEILQRVQRESFPGATNLGFHDPATFPSHRFRDCWRLDGQAIKVDMALARAQRLAEIRAARNVRFAALDAEWMRAIGQKRTAEADAIEAKRQVLRDVPQACAPLLDACATADELIVLEPNWPEV